MRIFILVFFIIFLNAEQIKKYDVNVNIDNDAKLIITENILYDFGNNHKHGIFRNIPVNNNSIDLIDVKRDNKTENYTTFYQDNDFVIKIGNKDKLITNAHLYTIKYSLGNVVFNKDENHNAISLNAIGTGWKTKIDNIKIIIHLPSILSNSKIKVFAGDKGSKNQIQIKKIDNLTYEIDKLSIKSHQGITFDIIFNKNLIKVKTLNNSWVYLFLIIFGIGLYFYYSKHKIPKFSISPKYYPPEFDVLQTGVLIDESADDKDFSTAILQLATKGYLKIIETNEKVLVFNKKTILLKKLKNGDDLEYDLKTLFNSLFDNSDKFILGEKDESKAILLRNNISKIDEWLYNWGVKNGYFFENPQKAKGAFFAKSFFIALPFIIFALFQTFSFYQIDTMIPLIIISIFMIVGIVVMTQSKIFGAIFFGVSVFMFFGLNVNLLNPFTLSLLSILIILFFSSKIGVYTKKGIESLKYILGFKEFLDRTQKDKIETLLKENPNYLDEVLPYAVLFGAKHWLKFYEEFNVNNNWYEGDRFYYMYDDLYDSFETTSNYTSSSSSDSFSGGGSVGGGSGGGGGGSW